MEGREGPGRKYKPLLPARPSTPGGEDTGDEPRATLPSGSNMAIPPRRANRHGAVRTSCESCRARKTAVRTPG